MKRKERNNIEIEIARYHNGYLPVHEKLALLHRVCELLTHYQNKANEYRELCAQKDESIGYYKEERTLLKVENTEQAKTLKYLNEKVADLEEYLGDCTLCGFPLKDHKGMYSGNCVGNADKQMKISAGGRSTRLHFDEVAHPGTPLSDAVKEDLKRLGDSKSFNSPRGRGISYVPRTPAVKEKDTVHKMREQLTELGYGRTAWNGDRKWTVHIFGVTDKTEGFMYRQSWFDTELEAYQSALNNVTWGYEEGVLISGNSAIEYMGLQAENEELKKELGKVQGKFDKEFSRKLTITSQRDKLKAENDKLIKCMEELYAEIGYMGMPDYTIQTRIRECLDDLLPNEIE